MTGRSCFDRWTRPSGEVVECFVVDEDWKRGGYLMRLEVDGVVQIEQWIKAGRSRWCRRQREREADYVSQLQQSRFA